MNGAVQLSIWQVLLAYVFVIVVLAIVRVRGVRREREILVASIRMTLQLIATGYVLGYVLENPNPLVTVAIILLMEAFACYTVFAKFKGRLSKGLKWSVVTSLTTGTLTCLLYFLFVVVQVSPWYDPQFFIPIAGMIVGNSMTGVALGVKSLLDGMTSHRALVEEALILGATPAAATHRIINSTFDAAIMPTINSMVGMGIIFLPGMMTGQILSGTSPTTAVMYQIAIMAGILCAVAVSVVMLLQSGYRTFFNDQAQLVS